MTHVVRARRTSRRIQLLSLIAVLGIATQLGLSRESGVPQEEARQTKIIGSDRLVSIQPLPTVNGELCFSDSAPETLMAALQQREAGVSRAASNLEDTSQTTIALDRPPLRTIRDRSPTFSAVAVDVKNNEIILQDENLFQIMVYDRTTNTPPTARLSEPKRIIGGLNTKMEFNCGLYVDSTTGDIYSVNNDTIDTMVVFSRNARGNVRPDRELSTPHRTYGITVDEGDEELFLTVQDPPMVVVYHKYAEGEAEPIRVLRGNRTGLADAHGIGLDTKNGWMFVANYGSSGVYADGGGNFIGGRNDAMIPGSGTFKLPSITVFPIKASGDTPALRTIQGPSTRLNWPGHIYVDQEHGELFVANDADDSILVFRVTDSEDVAPTRILKGPRTQLKNPTGIFVDTVNDELVVSNMGNHRATVYARTAHGNTPPIRTIRAGAEDKPALMIGNPGSVAYDTTREEILVPN